MIDERPFAENNYFRTILDAFPSPLFVVDNDMRVVDVNAAAANLAGNQPSLIFRRLCGDVLRCVHGKDSDHTCGTTEFCPDCSIRQSVGEAKANRKVIRRPYDMQTEQDGKVRRSSILITTAPFSHNGSSLILLTLEDVTELMELRELLPICAKCKKIRNDDDYWEQVESYLKNQMNLHFTHSICPDCAKVFLDDLDDEA